VKTLHQTSEDLVLHVQWNSAIKENRTPTYLIVSTWTDISSMHVRKALRFWTYIHIRGYCLRI